MKWINFFPACSCYNLYVETGGTSNTEQKAHHYSDNKWWLDFVVSFHFSCCDLYKKHCHKAEWRQCDITHDQTNTSSETLSLERGEAGPCHSNRHSHWWKSHLVQCTRFRYINWITHHIKPQRQWQRDILGMMTMNTATVQQYFILNIIGGIVCTP